MEAAPSTDYKAMYEEEKALRLSLQTMMAELQITITGLRHDIEGMRKMIFGSKSERFVPARPTNPSQLSLGRDAAVATDEPAQTRQIAYERRVEAQPAPKNQNHNGRSPLPEHLRREEIVLQPEDLPQGACLHRQRDHRGA